MFYIFSSASLNQFICKSDHSINKLLLNTFVQLEALADNKSSTPESNINKSVLIRIMSSTPESNIKKGLDKNY